MLSRDVMTPVEIDWQLPCPVSTQGAESWVRPRTANIPVGCQFLSDSFPLLKTGNPLVVWKFRVLAAHDKKVDFANTIVRTMGLEKRPCLSVQWDRRWTNEDAPAHHVSWSWSDLVTWLFLVWCVPGYCLLVPSIHFFPLRGFLCFSRSGGFFRSQVEAHCWLSYIFLFCFSNIFSSWLCGAISNEFVLFWDHNEAWGVKRMACLVRSF